ncbi:acetyl esterase/lipase [Lutibacter oceani]|uniref:Acetyl esterase/lipase n=1 Tax=Lutibacter oceani TaxID=1853311 RepID=A0A3D9RQD3_9FLAO|nr:alpha/beta hydrolase [Lutibacter oceani]REE82120.1 acetyl esterase/lipase [Lutibacter oceani]
MKIKKGFFIVFMLVSSILFSQEIIPIDTSYTVQNSFEKYKKNFPEIKIVKPQLFENVIEKKEIVYKEIGTRRLHLDVFYNKSEQLKPAVILVHGGGWKSGNKSHMEPLAQKIASNGYACFTVEYRLSLEAIYPEGIFDIKRAIQFIKANAAEFKIDAEKVAILGCSSGGQMAALIGTTNNNLTFEDLENVYNQSSSVQVIIDLDGVIAFIHPKSSEGAMAGEWLGGNSEEKLETWLQASALTHTNKNTPPILFINSQYERFHAGRDDMIKILDGYGIYSQVETIPESPHTFWLFHPWFNKTAEYIINFLEKTLK